MGKNNSNVFRDIYNQPYNYNTRAKLYSSTKSSLSLVQRMSLLKRLQIHHGCVNSICWNNTGDLLLSGSDDQHLVLTNPYTYQVLSDYKTSHRANIFSAKFLPHTGDHRIVSCSGDGIILYTDLMRKMETSHNQFTCHSGTAYEIATVPCEPHSFLSCGEDGTVRWFDLRMKEKCNNSRCREDILISCIKAVTAISVSPTVPHEIAIGCSDSTVRIYDRRMLGTAATGFKGNEDSAKPLHYFTVPEFEGNSYRITSLSYSPDGHDILASYSSDHLYLFNIKQRTNTQLKTDGSVSKNKGRFPVRSSQPVRRLRLRGDWSDTGPDARPEREGGRNSGAEIAQARPVLHTSLMRRMTDVLSRMLNDPATRAALSGGGEDSLEGVIDQQGEISQQNHDSSNDTNDAASSNMDEREVSAVVEPQSIESGTLNNHGLENSQDSVNELVEEVPAPELSPLSIGERSNVESAVPMEVESSHLEESETHILGTQSCDSSQSATDAEPRASDTTESPNSETDQNNGNMIENLQDRLSTMRDGFLERHGSEPTVKLRYSEKSSSSATISLGIADKASRDNFRPEPKEAPDVASSSTSDPGPSSSYNETSTYSTSAHEATEEDVYNDSDDEDATSDHRSCNPIEAEMDEAIANARAAQGLLGLNLPYPSDFCVKQKYVGHRNASFFRTMIKEANFWGDDFVMSGSDCGHVFVWERESARLCMLLQADQHVVNCVQPHPFLPILATSGIDYDVKLWAPLNDESTFDEKFAEDLMKRNAVMLEETKDTITVPAVFMIRMLACLNQIRRGRGRHQRRSGDDDQA